MWFIGYDSEPMMTMPKVRINQARAVMRMKSYILLPAVLISLAGMLCSCTPGKPPFLMVQLCLRDEQNLARFTSMVKSIAQSEGMEFIDRSAATEVELRSTDHVLDKLKQNTPIINLGIQGKDGVGMSAGNLGLPDYQVAIGFSEGLKPSEAHRFADTVVESLRQVWHVETVPTGRGAFPLKTCEKQPER